MRYWHFSSTVSELVQVNPNNSLAEYVNLYIHHSYIKQTRNHRRWNLGPGWRIFHILNSEDVDDFTDIMLDPLSNPRAGSLAGIAGIGGGPARRAHSCSPASPVLGCLCRLWPRFPTHKSEPALRLSFKCTYICWYNQNIFGHESLRQSSALWSFDISENVRKCLCGFRTIFRESSEFFRKQKVVKSLRKIVKNVVITMFVK